MSDFRPTKKEGDRYEADGTQGLIDTYSTKGIHAGVTARPELRPYGPRQLTRTPRSIPFLYGTTLYVVLIMLVPPMDRSSLSRRVTLT
jgi:hypothetical protein